MKILAVDDERFILELLIMMAKTAGFTDVTTASSGPDAIETIAQAEIPFDCIMLDISMPGMDGIELCSYIRKLPAYRRTPILMLTAMSGRDYIESAFRAGATDYLTKPFELAELASRLRIIEELLDARRLRASGAEQRFPGEDDNPFALDAEMEIEGITNLVSYRALQNYLTQLSDAGIAGSQVVALKIDNAESILSKASPEEFLYAITETAEALNAALISHQHMMAYVGKGLFVVVSSKATMESSVPLEVEVQGFLDEKQIEYDNGDPLDVEVSIGNPIRPSGHRTQRNMHTFDRAIARAERREEKKRDDKPAPSLRLINL